MYDCRNHRDLLNKWKLLFARDMLTVDNCLDVILFLDNCYGSIHFIRSLKKISSYHLIQKWPLVRASERWKAIK
jgi:hypothetical protein